ncbi:MAG TPA: hypothetical protein VLR27_12885 [Acidimicrobiales bacterium]|nr:hypothetical protein [Acidimicrobiales bacterium]
MRRRHAIIATTAGAALVGGLVLAPQAMADEHEEEAPASPSLCINLDISIQGTGEPVSLCLPPEGGEAPGLPELPGLPTP